ncbi:MAG: hypothetical protein LUG54_08820, partial [Clostridiales bacterium]|nr:hypothetical protein [Clostridiales bacterium]
AGSGDSAVRHSFGYSFPAEDAELGTLLFGGDKTVIIYYKDREDYAYKMIRLIRLFGKEDFLKKMYGGMLSFEQIR